MKNKDAEDESNNNGPNYKKEGCAKDDIAEETEIRRGYALCGHEILGCVNRIVIDNLEHLFYRWGVFVSTNPVLVILVSFSLAASSLLGFFNFTSESRAEKLWIPSDSLYISNKEWLDKNFQENMRLQFALLNSPDENILNPKSLLRMLKLHQNVRSVQVGDRNFAKMCLRLPVTDLSLDAQDSDAVKRRRKRRETNSRMNREIPWISAGDLSPRNDDGEVRVKKQVNDTLVVFDDASNNESSNSSENEDYLYDYYDEDFDPSLYSELNLDNSNIRRNESDSSSDELNQDSLTDDLPPQVYCDLISTLNYWCAEYSILQIWKFNEDIIRNLTSQDIIDGVNNVKKSPIFGTPFDYTTLLGEKTFNSTGHIVSAKAARFFWITTYDINDLLVDNGGIGFELDLVDEVSLEWEKRLVETMLRLDSEFGLDDQFSGPKLKLLMNVGRSFSDIIASTLLFDGAKMVVGYFLMFVYTVLMLGRITRLELRLYLTAAGILSIAMGLAMAYGFGAMFGLPYTPIHAILPFLCLGIGIDDMFVILQCWYNLSKKERRNSPLPQLIGETMRHAGVAITVTSLTDVCVFGLGAVTILPGLRSFCVSCAIGIGSIFLLQASWFVAWLSLDQKRIADGRDGLCPCITLGVDGSGGCHDSHVLETERGKVVVTENHKTVVNDTHALEEDDDEEKSYDKMLMEKYSSLFESKVFKVVVIVVTLSFLSVGIYGSIQMKQEFDPVLLLPSDTYLRQWIENDMRLFPSSGWQASVYVGGLNYTSQDFQSVQKVVTNLQKLKDDGTYVREVDTWWTHFQTYLNVKIKVSNSTSLFHNDNLNENNSIVEDFKQTNKTDSIKTYSLPKIMSDFLYHKNGSSYQRWIKFDSPIVCNQPASHIKALKIATVTYVHMNGPSQHIPARQAVDSAIESAGFSQHAFSFSKIYAAWETDQVIGFELWRNLTLAMVSVLVITLVLLARFKICLMVFVSVLFTLIDMIGVLHFWDITIDTISCINIVLAVGLCVDYSAHMAHAFIVATGTSTQRTSQGLTSIGPAVLNGGITTLLALVLLGFSKSYAFIVFFKVFLLTVFFGLFHGLVLLPVLLTIFGSSNCYSASPSLKNRDDVVKNKNEKIPPSVGDTSSSKVFKEDELRDIVENNRDSITHDTNKFIADNPGFIPEHQVVDTSEVNNEDICSFKSSTKMSQQSTISTDLSTHDV